MWFAGVYVYLRPTTLEEALEALYQSRGELLAGGLFVGLAFVAGCVRLLWVGYRYVQRIAPRGAL